MTDKLSEHKKNLAALKSARDQMQLTIQEEVRTTEEHRAAQVREILLPRYDGLLYSAQCAIAELLAVHAAKFDVDVMGVDITKLAAHMLTIPSP